MGGFTTGGLNFDAKVRRESFEPIDLFHAHIGGMDAFARGLKIAAAIRDDGRLDGLRQATLRELGQRHRQRIESGSSNFDDLTEWVKQNPEPVIASGRQELMENILNELL